MVELVAAGAGEDTRLVELEARLIGLNGNGDRLHVDGGLELVLVLRCDILEGSDAHRRRRGLGLLASASLGSVRVLGLEGVALGLDVLEAVVHETTVAALVTEGAGAVDELLLGEREKLASLEEVGALDRSRGGECPA
jgi:hypothetical protein